MLTEQHTQEGLSRSYIHAIAGISGVNLVAEREFDYGFDGTFRGVELRGKRRVETSFPIDFQLKCTKNWKFDGDLIRYNVESKTYNDLVSRHPCGTGAILILLCLPEDRSNWLEIREEYMKLQKCCYYIKLQGKTVPNEKSTKLIKIPRSNILNKDSLKTLLTEERNRRIGAATC